MPVFFIVLIFGLVVSALTDQFFEADRQKTVYGGSTDAARAWLAYHDAEVGYVTQNPGASGTLPAPALTDVPAPAPYTSCYANKLVVTWPSGLTEQSPGALVVQARKAHAGDTNMGVVSSGSVTTVDGRTIALPCAVPNKEPVVFTQVVP